MQITGKLLLFFLHIMVAGSLGQLQRAVSPRLLSLGPCLLLGDSDPCSGEHLKFFLFTRTNPEEPELVDAVPGYSNLSASTFDPAHPTKLIIHGYNSNIDLGVLQDIKDAYLSRGDYNVFMPEWSTLGETPCYPAAAHNARHVGRCTAELLRHVAAVTSRQEEPLPSDLHVIGFSLGAQVAGFVAEFLAPLRLPRITGLDPALPFFLTPNAAKKLDPSDALFVDVIHTNALMQGQLQATGHLDFYLNGGFSQPGCETADSPSACNHHRAPSYFAESIVSPRGFWGWPCGSWFSYVVGSCSRQDPTQLMGEFVDHTARGVYYVDTDSTPPFALGRTQDKVTPRT